MLCYVGLGIIHRPVDHYKWVYALLTSKHCVKYAHLSVAKMERQNSQKPMGVLILCNPLFQYVSSSVFKLERFLNSIILVDRCPKHIPKENPRWFLREGS